MSDQLPCAHPTAEAVISQYSRSNAKQRLDLVKYDSFPELVRPLAASAVDTCTKMGRATPPRRTRPWLLLQVSTCGRANKVTRGSLCERPWRQR